MDGLTDWKTELKQSLRTASDLYDAGFISKKELNEYRPLLDRYRFLLPRYYAGLIDKKDPECPIRLQAIPLLKELERHANFTPDPLGDLQHQPASRITHRYQNRVLIHLTSNCSMYCRYCFRKSLLNDLSNGLFSGVPEEAIGYVRQRPEIQEVIFSGGDPLMLSDTSLENILQALSKCSQLRRIRLHTRVPVTFPARITTDLVQTLSRSAYPIVVVTHFNHPKEFTPDSFEACRKLRSEGRILLLNQSVLLKDVNNKVSTLESVSHRLFEFGILPYYLHHPDRAEGTRHFFLSPEEGIEILKALREKLPGYLVPRYVIDVVGFPYKRDVESYFFEAATGEKSTSMGPSWAFNNSFICS